MANQSGSLPTRKWMVTQVTAVAALLVAFIQAGSWSSTLSVVAVGIVSQAVIAYLVPNADAPAAPSAPAGPADPPLAVD